MNDTISKVKVGHWESVHYHHGDRVCPNDSFVCALRDDRAASGQVVLDLYREGADDSEAQALYVYAEVGDLPGVTDEAPCLHVSTDMDDALLSIFRAKDRLIIRVNEGRFTTTRLKDGSLALEFDVDEGGQP